jgi:hypothetical protein
MESGPPPVGTPRPSGRHCKPVRRAVLSGSPRQNPRHVARDIDPEERSHSVGNSLAVEATIASASRADAAGLMPPTVAGLALAHDSLPSRRTGRKRSPRVAGLPLYPASIPPRSGAARPTPGDHLDSSPPYLTAHDRLLPIAAACHARRNRGYRMAARVRPRRLPGPSSLRIPCLHRLVCSGPGRRHPRGPARPDHRPTEPAPAQRRGGKPLLPRALARRADTLHEPLPAIQSRSNRGGGRVPAARADR